MSHGDDSMRGRGPNTYLTGSWQDLSNVVEEKMVEGVG